MAVRHQATGPIEAGHLEAMLAELDEIGVGAQGVNRLAWTQEDAALRDWFDARAERVGLEPVSDTAGNRWAVPSDPAPWWGVGSHLDSVRDGGRFDGPLGVATALAVAEHCERPIAVICFADEEGARFNTPTFGSRALVGRLDLDDALARVDDSGVSLSSALAGAGVDPGRLGEAPAWLDRLAGFLELHIDQSLDVHAAGASVGVVRALAARLRLQVEIRGRGDHAGTTPREERADALLAAARLIAAVDSVSADLEVVRATATRLLVEPNALTTVPSHARLWIDARSADEAALSAFEGALLDHADGSPCEFRFSVAARSPGIEFHPGVREELLRAAPAGTPEVVCFAGHDAGIIGAMRSAGMVLVRNATGVSHTAAEHVELEDAAVGANALLAAVEALG
ncbi:MAG: hydantoinase/carbamoylase family amidase [Actinobacteria bacterium]|nr:hydantoinase/carbamoylase family amidase [Actinomycetota bacterium]